MLQTKCVSLGSIAACMCVGASGGGRLACKFDGGGFFPEGNTSSRWLIDIRTDLSLLTALAAAAISTSGPRPTRSPNSLA
jgi:hypothetical protein